MKFSDINNYLEFIKEIYIIDPKFIINFHDNKFIATCTYAARPNERSPKLIAAHQEATLHSDGDAPDA